ncbi:MAG: prepilin-type N-terminal cleavage/methylation domain-containing protein [Planctomycetota bacterium]
MRRAFSLIELLVVISIIALLIAILLPALGRAKHSAMLSQCLSNQRQVAIGGMNHAADNKELWPEREMPFNENGLSAPHVLKFSSGEADKAYDDRPALTPYIDLNLVGQCPFNKQLDYENSTADQIQGNYNFYFGFEFYSNEQRMENISDKMTFDGDEFDIIVGDMTKVYADRPWTRSAHPVKGTGGMGANVRDDATWTSASYLLTGTIDRGGLELNFTRTDGSGFTIGSIQPEDPRLKKVPYKHGNPVAARWTLLPSTDF